MAIKLPDLVQRIKVDASDMKKAEQVAAGFGSKMKAAGRDSDAASRKMQENLDKTAASAGKVDDKYDSLIKKTRTLRDEANRGGTSTLVTSMRALSEETTKTNKQLTEADKNARAFSTRIKTIPTRVRSEVLTSERGAREAGLRISNAARDRRTKVRVDVDKSSLDSLMRRLGDISGNVAGLNFKSNFTFWSRLAIPAGIIAGIESALPLVGALATDLIDLSKTALILPAGISALAASFGVLAIGLKGLGDAKDKVSMDFKDTFKEIGKDFKSLQTQMRTRMLVGVGDEIRKLYDTAIPKLTLNLRLLSDTWNSVFKDTAQFLRTPRIIGDLNAILAGTRPILLSMSDSFQNIIGGFLDLSKIGMPVVRELAKSFGGLTAQFSAWTQKGMKDGSIRKMMEEGLDATKRLWGVVTTLGSAIGGLMKTARDGGVSFIGVLQNIADWMDDLFNSPLVQKGLISAFEGVSDLLGGIFSQMGPFKTIFADLGQIVGKVGTTLGNVARTILPVLVQGFHNLVPAADDLVGFMVPFNEVIRALAPSFLRVTAALGPFIQKLIEIGSGVVRDVAPLVQHIAETIADLLPQAIRVVVPTLEAFRGGIQNLVPVLRSLVDFLRPIVEWLLNIAAVLGPFVAGWAPAALAVLGLVKALSMLKGAVGGSAIVGMLGGATGGLTRFRGAVDNARLRTMYFQDSVKAAGGGLRGFSSAAAGVASRGLAAGFSSLAGAISPVGIALAAVTGGLMAYINAQAEAAAAQDAFIDTLDEITGKTTGASKTFVLSAIMKDFNPNDVKLLQSMGVSFSEATNAAIKGGPALTTYVDRLKAMRQALQDSGQGWGIQARALDGLISTLGNQNEVITDAINKYNALSGAQKDLAAQEALSAAASAAFQAATGSEAQAAQNAAAAQDAYNRKIREKSQAQFGANDAAREYFLAQQEINKALKDGAQGLNFNTAEGVRNTQMMDRLIAAGNTKIEQAKTDKLSIEGQMTVYSKQRASLIKTAERFGLTRAQAKAYVDKLLEIPADRKTRVDAATKVAQSNVQKVIDKLKATQSKSVTVTAATASAVSAVGRVIAALSRVQSKSITVSVNASVSGIRTAIGQIGALTAAAANAQADGGYYPKGIKAFAAGGIENHVAQIARGGAYRLWAEPETGGESYIPHAPSKRARSRSIWAETGVALGFDPARMAAILAMADGGILQSAVQNSQRPVSNIAVAAPNSGGLRIIKGTLTLVNGEAYIRGIAQDVADNNDNFQNTLKRMH